MEMELNKTKWKDVKQTSISNDYSITEKRERK